MTTVALVEDDPQLREILVDLLTGAGDLRLGPVAGSGEELIELLAKAPAVEVALVDLGLPGMSGQQLIAELRRDHPHIACVAHTVFEDPKAVFGALRAGAAGYLLKGGSGPELLRSLRSLNEGGAPLTPRIARLLLGEFREERQGPLSDREREVLSHLALGRSYKEIASLLVVSSHTVHTHVKHIYEKLQASGRRDALAKARRQGWLDA